MALDLPRNISVFIPKHGWDVRMGKSYRALATEEITHKSGAV